MGSAWCPRCGSDLVPPGLYDSSWRCDRHGRVYPFMAFRRHGSSTLAHLRQHSEVPVWRPQPMPAGWSAVGLAAAGDDRTRIRATVAAYRGPAPLGGEGEWLIIAEEPGVGVGAGYSGAPDPDFLTEAPHYAKIHVLGHPTALWPIPVTKDDRSVYVGEAGGVWIWLVSFPADAGYAVLEDLGLVDARYHNAEAEAEVERSGSSVRLRPGDIH